MESNVFKLSNAGGMSSRTRYWSMLAGNTTWVPFTPTGSFESIATVTVGAGGASSISFSSISGAYQHLQLRCLLKSTNAGSVLNAIYIQFNSDTGSNYSWHQVYGYNNAAGAGSGVSQSNMYPTYMPLSDSNVTNMFGGLVVDVLDYVDTNKYTTIRGLGGFDLNYAASYSGVIALGSGNWRNTAAVNAITFSTTGGNFAQYSQVSLYGVKA